MKKRLAKLIRKILKPGFKPFSSFPYRVVPAFEMGGVTYYEVENMFNTPCMRALAAITYYEEVRMKCNFEYLEAWSLAQGNIITQAKQLFSVQNGKLNLNAIIEKLNDLDQRNARLKERLKLSVDLDAVYKLASVVYFDDTENPYQYEMQYGLAKIEFWKKQEDAAAFFLRMPIKRLVPYLNGQSENILFYQQVVEQIKEQDTKEVLSNLSSQQKTKFTTLTSPLKKVV